MNVQETGQKIEQETNVAKVSTEVKVLKERMLQKSYYLMFREVVDGSRIPDLMLDHYRWLIGLEKEGKVFASGPLFEKNGEQGVGMTVFSVAGWEEAEALASNDPFCASGAMKFSIRRWQVNEGRIKIAIDFSDGTYSIG